MSGDIPKKLSYKKEDFGSDNHATYKYLWSIQKNSILIYYFNNDSKRYKVNPLFSSKCTFILLQFKKFCMILIIFTLKKFKKY